MVRGLVDAVATHKLGHEERAEGVVALLSDEAELGGGSFGRIGHLLLGVVRRLLEELTLGQHAGSDFGGRVAELADVRLFGEAVDSEVGLGVAAGFAVDGLDGVLEFYFLILTHNTLGFKGLKMC